MVTVRQRPLARYQSSLEDKALFNASSFIIKVTRENILVNPEWQGWKSQKYFDRSTFLVCVCICSWHFSRFALLFPACHLRFLRACHLSQSCVGAPAFLIRLPAEKTLIRAVDIDNVVYIRQSDREHFNACTGLSNSYKAFLRRRLVKAM